MSKKNTSGTVAQTPLPEKKQKETKKETKKSKFADKADKIFKGYPNATEVYFSSDGIAFFNESDAINYAKTLKDKEVKTETKEK